MKELSEVMQLARDKARNQSHLTLLQNSCANDCTILPPKFKFMYKPVRRLYFDFFFCLFVCFSGNYYNGRIFKL